MSDEQERTQDEEIDAQMKAQREMIEETNKEGYSAREAEEEARKQHLRANIEATRQRIAEGGTYQPLYGSSPEEQKRKRDDYEQDRLMNEKYNRTEEET